MPQSFWTSFTFAPFSIRMVAWVCLYEFGGITNLVNSDLDLDGMVDYIATKTTETIEIAAEGVHQ